VLKKEARNKYPRKVGKCEKGKEKKKGEYERRIKQRNVEKELKEGRRKEEVNREKGRAKNTHQQIRRSYLAAKRVALLHLVWRSLDQILSWILG
jgi:hypothetical protein